MTVPAYSPPPSPQQPASKTWWQRNWKWFVPVGCLGVLVMFVGFIATIVFVVFAGMRTAEPVRVGIASAEASPAVRAQLGSPVDPGWWMSGSMSVSGPSGSAEVSVPVSGPSGSGTLYVKAYKRAGKWHYAVLEVEIDGRPDRVDLLPSAGVPRAVE